MLALPIAIARQRRIIPGVMQTLRGLLAAAWCVALLAAGGAHGEVAPATCARAESRAVRRVVQEYLLPQVAKQKDLTLPRACPLHPERNM